MKLRWSVHMAQMDPTTGHEQGGKRPVLIVSNEPFNRASGLVTVVPFTTARRSPHPWELLVPQGLGGLPVASLLLPHHLRTISRSRLDLPGFGRISETNWRQSIAAKILDHLAFRDLDRLSLEG